MRNGPPLAATGRTTGRCRPGLLVLQDVCGLQEGGISVWAMLRDMPARPRDAASRRHGGAHGAGAVAGLR